MQQKIATEREYGLGLVQGSIEWLIFKCGRIGSSEIADLTAKIKSGASSASRTNLMGRKIAERLTGVPSDSYRSAAMQAGNDVEPMARAAYQFERLCVIKRVGVVLHPKIPMALASPDGLVGDDGLIEAKCPLTHTHIETLLGGPIPGDYHKQMMWQMACTGRQWCDYISFDPRLPEHMRLHIQRVPRDDVQIPALEIEVMAFLLELDRKLAELNARFPMQEAA